MSEGYGMAGQRPPRQRQAGKWVELEREQGVGPATEEAVNLNSMKRAELDAYAQERGVDPSEYSNMDDLREALEGK